ncbi:hypothetical protein TrST_g2610 [Triparma strigata]|nr:hypothetical protein TrST_g2610 [Triparma strigata]
MDTRYTFTSTIKDYDNNKKQEILNVITPDGKTVETKKPYKSQFTVKTPKGPYESVTLTHHLLPSDGPSKKESSTLTVSTSHMTLLTLPCTSHRPIFSGRYGGITYDPSTNTIYYTGKSIDFDEIFEKSHFPTSSTPPTKSPKHQKYIVSNSGYGESDGEQMKSSNLSLQSLYSLSLETYEIEKMEGTESCFNPVYTEKHGLLSSKSLETSKKLGKVYCYNRPQSTVSHLNKPWNKIEYERTLINVAGSIVSFGGNLFKSHVGYVQVYIDGCPVSMEGVGGEICLVEDCVEGFNQKVEGEVVWVNCWVGMECKIVEIDVKKKKVGYVELTKVWERLGRKFDGCMVLRLEEDKAYLKVSEQTDPGGIVIVDRSVISGGGGEGEAKFISYRATQTSTNPVPLSTFSANFSVEQVNMNFSGTNPLPECSVYKPHNVENPKIILVPHGGPHSVSPLFFSPALAWLANLGYCVVTCNYRGSIGFGQDYVTLLPSNVGDYDVKDCMSILEHVKEKIYPNNEEVYICGGSHGGFLTAHLIGQYPDYFKKGALRNPVTNIASMVGVTDIPDWCVYEATGEYDFSSYEVPGPDVLKIMWDKSPMQYVEKVKAKVLLALGDVDLRVPVSQGLEYYYALKGKGKDVECMRFEEDCHPLAKPDTEFSQWLRIAELFGEE